MTTSNSKKVLFVIPARSGSTGLPGKNIRKFHGRPLMLWTLELAAKFLDIADIVVSSDSDEYLSIASEWREVVLRKRPDRLATSETPMSLVIQDACHHVVNQRKVSYEWVVLLDVTNPLRTYEDVRLAIENLDAACSAVSGVVSISRPHFNPAWVTVSMDSGGAITRWNKAGSAFTGRQQAPELFRMNGVFYCWRFEIARNLVDPWLEQGNYLGVEVDDHRGISIDTDIDFKVAEMLFDSKIWG